MAHLWTGDSIVPIRRFIQDHGFSPEALTRMNDALDVASLALRIELFEEDRRDALGRLIVKLALTDPSLNSAQLSERAIKIFLSL